MVIRSMRFGDPVAYPTSHGDLWTSTWADDGTLYSASDDTTGFDRACSSNLAINRIEGDAPLEMFGTTINGMGEFGGWGEVLPEDGQMWKANGLTCIEGVLYMTVSRHGDPTAPPYYIQETWDASIVKSEDHGQTWSKAPALGRSMFPGPSFSTPFFVEYGRDGQAGPDGSDTYVYAISNGGSWNNGDAMGLGRVRRDAIGRLDPADWEFVQHFERDGELVWAPRHDTVQYVFRAPGRTSMTGLHFVAPLGVYILPQWHYTHLEDDTRRFKATRWEMYEAPAPWGPWRLVHTRDWEPEGFYNPTIPSKFISPDGRRLWFFTAGDWTTCNDPDGQRLYSLWMIPVEIEVEEEK